MVESDRNNPANTSTRANRLMARLLNSLWPRRGGKVHMNIIDGSDPHTDLPGIGQPSLATRTGVRERLAQQGCCIEEHAGAECLFDLGQLYRRVAKVAPW